MGFKASALRGGYGAWRRSYDVDPKPPDALE
jgi:hypothetical protein